MVAGRVAQKKLNLQTMATNNAEPRRSMGAGVLVGIGLMAAIDRRFIFFVGNSSCNHLGESEDISGNDFSIFLSVPYFPSPNFSLAGCLTLINQKACYDSIAGFSSNI